MLRDEYHDQFLILYFRSKQNDNTIVTANVKYINCFMIDSIENMKSTYSKIRVLENYDLVVMRNIFRFLIYIIYNP